MVYASPGSGQTNAGKKKLGARPVNTNLRPGSVNTNWGQGPLNANWGPGPVNINRGPVPGPGAKQRAGGREIQIPYNRNN